MASSPLNVMAVPAMNQQQAQSSPYYTTPRIQPEVAPSIPDEQSNKRKLEDIETPTTQRSKRNRYISIACNECKRRKIKCNGESPCQRCGNLSLECIYAPNCCTSNFKDSEEFKAMTAHIASLQQQVNELWSHVHTLRNGQSPFPMHPSLAHTESSVPYQDNVSPIQSRANHPHYEDNGHDTKRSA